MSQSVRFQVYSQSDDTQTMNSVESLFQIIGLFNQITEIQQEERIRAYIRRRNNILNYNTIDILNIINGFDSDIEDLSDLSIILRESMEDGGLEKDDEQKIIVSSQRYDTIYKCIEKDDDCTICSEKFDKDSFVSLLSCNHHFHTNCIKEWGKYNNVCPICRTEISKQ